MLLLLLVTPDSPDALIVTRPATGEQIQRPEKGVLTQRPNSGDVQRPGGALPDTG